MNEIYKLQHVGAEGEALIKYIICHLSKRSVYRSVSIVLISLIVERIRENKCSLLEYSTRCRTEVSLWINRESAAHIYYVIYASSSTPTMTWFIGWWTFKKKTFSHTISSLYIWNVNRYDSVIANAIVKFSEREC